MTGVGQDGLRAGVDDIRTEVMTPAVPLGDQIAEAELHVLGLRDQILRALSGKIKRPSETIQRMQKRLKAAEAVSGTLRGMMPAGGSPS